MPAGLGLNYGACTRVVIPVVDVIAFLIPYEPEYLVLAVADLELVLRNVRNVVVYGCRHASGRNPYFGSPARAARAVYAKLLYRYAYVAVGYIAHLHGIPAGRQPAYIHGAVRIGSELAYGNAGNRVVYRDFHSCAHVLAAVVIDEREPYLGSGDYGVNHHLSRTGVHHAGGLNHVPAHPFLVGLICLRQADQPASVVAVGQAVYEYFPVIVGDERGHAAGSVICVRTA